MNRGVELWERAVEILPGGSQLLSKQAEQFLPGRWPAYYRDASGVRVRDLDGNEYLDMSIMGIGAAVLGYADEDVDAAVTEAVGRGTMTTLNPPEEVELAERLLTIDPWADMVRYARTGGESMAIAVRLARAATGRDTVAFCGYHGWHDWYLAANLAGDDNLEGHLMDGLEPLGVPSQLEGTAVPFRYNDAAALEAIAEEQDLAAIVMEPKRNEEPTEGFLETVRHIANETGAVLIFDEITSGWRVVFGGLYQRFNVTPDVVVYGKAIANGYPMAAVVGRDWVMDKAQESFISSSFWTERIGPVAALATLEKMEANDVQSRLVEVGRSVQAGLRGIGEANDVPVTVEGLAPLTHFSFDVDDSRAVATLFTQEMLDRGYLASTNVYASYSHTDVHVEAYLEDASEVFADLAGHVAEGRVREALDGPVAHAGFERLN